mmetsp:Transcript_37881/g.91861  ORF Transcript_37881/g.91861 Transcript_37881/m.91861 type:complete len:272 (+) Transcript_37881:2502-3317(+)
MLPFREDSFKCLEARIERRRIKLSNSIFQKYRRIWIQENCIVSNTSDDADVCIVFKNRYNVTAMFVRLILKEQLVIPIFPLEVAIQNFHSLTVPKGAFRRQQNWSNAGKSPMKSLEVTKFGLMTLSRGAQYCFFGVHICDPCCCLSPSIVTSPKHVVIQVCASSGKPAQRIMRHYACWTAPKVVAWVMWVFSPDLKASFKLCQHWWLINLDAAILAMMFQEVCTFVDSIASKYRIFGRESITHCPCHIRRKLLDQVATPIGVVLQCGIPQS